jgi:glycosyltransferase involved in cell wall biosynthesis
MKIIFLSTGDPVFDRYPTGGGGIQYQIMGFSRELTKRGHEVYVLMRHDGVKEKVIDGVNFVGVKTHFKDLILTRIIFSKNAISKIMEINPEVLVLNERFSAFLPSRLEIPKVFFTHNYDAFKFYKQFAVRYNRLNHLIFPIKNRVEEGIMRRSNMVLCLNAAIEEYLHERGIKNAEVIPSCVDASEYSDRGDEDFILYAGRLNRVKGVEYLIRAFYALKDDYSHDLVLIGSGPDEERLKKIVSSLNIEDRVRFIPWVEKGELKGYYSKCTLFALPSLFETFGVVLLEAMASRKPSIASNIMGPKDIITSGKDGFLFERRNTDELRKCLELCLSDESLRRKIGKNARKTVEENYSFEKITNNLVRVFDGLI